MLTGPGISLILKDLVKIAHNFFLASSSPQVSLNLILLKNFKNLRSLTQYSCKIKEQLRRKKSQYLFCLTTPFLDFTLSSKFDIKGLSNLVEDNSLKRKRALQPEYVLSIWYSQYYYPANTVTYKRLTVKLYSGKQWFLYCISIPIFTGGLNIPNSSTGMFMGPLWNPVVTPGPNHGTF